MILTTFIKNISYTDVDKGIEYLQKNGFDTSLVKISPKTHIITDEHIDISGNRLGEVTPIFPKVEISDE